MIALEASLRALVHGVVCVNGRATERLQQPFLSFIFFFISPLLDIHASMPKLKGVLTFYFYVKFSLHSFYYYFWFWVFFLKKNFSI